MTYSIPQYRSQQGSYILEFAASVFTIMTLLLGLIDLTTMFRAYHDLQAAAQAAAHELSSIKGQGVRHTRSNATATYTWTLNSWDGQSYNSNIIASNLPAGTVPLACQSPLAGSSCEVSARNLTIATAAERSLSFTEVIQERIIPDLANSGLPRLRFNCAPQSSEAGCLTIRFIHCRNVDNQETCAVENQQLPSGETRLYNQSISSSEDIKVSLAYAAPLISPIKLFGYDHLDITVMAKARMEANLIKDNLSIINTTTPVH